MAQNFQIEPERYAFESQIRELYGRCAYSHKTHMKMADRLGNRLWLGKWANIIISALITGGAVGVLFGKESQLDGSSWTAPTTLLLRGRAARIEVLRP